jgi:hypothetical protein
MDGMNAQNWITLAMCFVTVLLNWTLVTRFLTRLEVELREAIRRIGVMEKKIDSGKVVIYTTRRRKHSDEEYEEDEE